VPGREPDDAAGLESAALPPTPRAAQARRDDLDEAARFDAESAEQRRHGSRERDLAQQ